MTGKAQRRGMRVLACLGMAVLALGFPSGAPALELASDEAGEKILSLDTAAKWSSLLSYAPDDPFLYPSRKTGVALVRLRLGLRLQYHDWMNAELAYEQRFRYSSTAGGAGSSFGALPSLAEAPYRLTQLDWEIVDGDKYAYRHELDRALVAFHPEWGEVIIGRQAIGLGRGVIFSAVDVFAPFNPVEVDREWRRGVDAIRCEYRLTQTSSAEVIGVFGRNWDGSAILGRVRGYVGDLDAELILGKRGRDAMLATSVSAAVKDAEVHFEAALFRTHEKQPQGGLFGNDHLVSSMVLGSSYTFDVGNGLTLLGEYHYSGFGLKDVEDANVLFRDPAFQQRFLRGDTQLVGRHALAAQLSYPVNETLGLGLLILESPRDGSGMISPAVTWDVNQTTSVRLSGFAGWGQSPKDGRIRSEYGGTPASIFLQLAMYF